MYYGYHQTAKRLIKDGHCLYYSVVEEYNKICPALVLYFDNHIPMPIRQYRWLEYDELLLSVSNKSVT